jgi:hypothetical protein
VLRWTVPGTVLRDVIALRQLYLSAKPSHMGVDVDGLAYPLHHPTAYGCESRAQSPLSDTSLLYLVTKLLLMEPLPKLAHTL